MGYGVYEVIGISIMNWGTSHGKSSVVNGSLNFMSKVKWTLSLGTKVGKRAVKNPLSNTYEQRYEKMLVMRQGTPFTQ